MPEAPLHYRSARSLTTAIRTGELSAAEVMLAHLQRIEQLNPRLNAIVSLRAEEAVAEAVQLDRHRSREPTGPLHGLPVAVKDLVDTAGLRTTYGSAAFADHVPDADALIVTRLKAAGAIIVGKTNVPEFGTGSHTFNEVFGATRNPWAPERSAGGSSGGAGAALAAGMVPLADGSDHGGSIRNPASFNNLAGLRPTPGLVPDPDSDAWNVTSVLGPLARTVDDLSLMLSAIVGPDPRVPLSHGDPAAFADTEPVALDGLRVGWSPDVGGLPIEPAVRSVLVAARERLVAVGAVVHDVELGLDGVDEAFETLRAVGFVASFADAPAAVRDALKQTIRANVAHGLALDGAAVARAQTIRSSLFRAVAGVLAADLDVIVAPAAQVTPFPLQWEYPREVDGAAMGSYLEWMRACTRITVTGHPVAAVPAGFTDDGLPVGIQLVGRHGGDRRLLGIAAACESAFGLTARRPPLD